jgi:Uma2 family endonuclease
MTETAARLLTADEFAALPDEPGAVLELVRGEVRSMPKPKPRHGRVAGKLYRRIGDHVERNGLGETYTAETGFLIARNPDTVRGPDAAFVSKARLATVADPDEWMPFAPDLVVEVTSPDDRRREIAEKIADWLAGGARLLWQVHPDTRTVEVHRPGAPVQTLRENDLLDGLDVLPGFRLRVGELFE